MHLDKLFITIHLGKSYSIFITQIRVVNFNVRRNLVTLDKKIVNALSNKNAVGFTEMNGDEQFIQVHNKLNKEDFIVTLLHEFVHVVQNEKGMIDETEREQQAYDLEGILYNNYCASEGTVH